MSAGTRRAPATLTLLLAVAVPIWAHEVGRPFADPCADPAALIDVRRVPGTRIERERADRYTEFVTQQTEGTVAAPIVVGNALHVRIVRSFEPLYVYSQPLRFLDERIDVREQEIRWVEGDGGRIPAWYVRAVAPNRLFAAYTFVYDGRVVTDPLREQLAGSVSQLVRGTKPMTLLLVSGEAKPRRLKAASERSLEWLGDAWEFYRSTCGG